MLDGTRFYLSYLKKKKPENYTGLLLACWIFGTVLLYSAIGFFAAFFSLIGLVLVFGQTELGANKTETKKDKILSEYIKERKEASK